MKKKVTITEIAKELGVSTTTINAALNGKGRVSEDTRKRVVEACKKLGYKPNRAAVSLARKPIKIGFLWTESSLEYDLDIINGARKACEELSDYNVSGDFFVAGLPNSRQKIINRIREMGEAGYDGVIIDPTYDKREYCEIIEGLRSRGVAVATVVSAIPGSKSLFSVRNNGVISGRLAADLLWMLVRKQPVAIFTGQRDHGVHKENIDGFMEVQKIKPLNVVEIYESHDDPEVAYHLADKLLREYPDIAGLYISTQNSSTICKRVVEAGLGGKVRIVASDIYPELAEYIRNGIVDATLFQDPFNQGRLVFKYLYEHIAEGKKFEGDILLKPQIILQGNLQLYT